MAPFRTLTMVDGVQIVVRDDLSLITPYVLQEQGDWFEDEIRFVRKLLQPGDAVIDIGANHGVYALSMARAVGPQGRVWAFEPASEPAHLLQQSIACNGFTQLNLDRSAMSSRVGEAQLSVSQHSEQNTLTGAGASSSTETVPLTTLDHSMASLGWRDIALVKIDAEGEEARILEGGRGFLAGCSPLVQYEVRAGHDVQLHLVQAFAEHGYRSYRLLGHLGVLVPFDADTALDDFVLNLFACKPDRAEALASRGMLILPGAPVAAIQIVQQDWREHLLSRPYGQRLATLWEGSMAQGRHAGLAQALALHAAAQDASHAPAKRFATLQHSLQLFSAAATQPGPHLHLASVARVATELGERTQALNALAALCTGLRQRSGIGPALPFLAPAERFDSIAPRGDIGNWVLAAAMEQQERLSSHSSYFSGSSTWAALKAIVAMGYASDETHRRLALMQRRFGLETGTPQPAVTRSA